MCESYILKCCCGAQRAELFFGKMLLDQTSVKQLFCPECSKGIEKLHSGMVWDNGWVLELNMDIINKYSATFSVDSSELTAGWIFDSGYVTWVGITPNDGERRNLERQEILQLAQTDVLAYFQAMKEWGQKREKQFSKEGWRKMHS